MLPPLSRFCSHQAMPNPCPSCGPTASTKPSPLMSNPQISAPPAPPCEAPQRPNAVGCIFHVPLVPVGGCSHQPYAFRKSARPSPLMSATPRPCPILTPQGPGSDTSYVVHKAVGFAGSHRFGSNDE